MQGLPATSVKSFMPLPTILSYRKPLDALTSGMEILNLISSWRLRLDLSAERLGEILESAAEPVVEIFEIEWLSDTSPQIGDFVGVRELWRETK